MDWLIDNLVLLISIALMALLVMALLAPLDSLGWWAGWRTRTSEQHAVPGRDPDAIQPAEAERYVDRIPGMAPA
jgi:hypothetical protein